MNSEAYMKSSAPLFFLSLQPRRLTRANRGCIRMVLDGDLVHNIDQKLSEDQTYFPLIGKKNDSRFLHI